jgi:predicted amidophosphoribosyltransferase
MWATLADLLLPAACAACGGEDERLSYEVCADCVAELEALRAGPTRPTPAPEALPPCFCLGGYRSELRELIIAFKDRGRHRLARPLGALLAEVIAAALPDPGAVTLVYIPDSAAAARERHGDHMRALARSAASRLHAAGRPVSVVNALRSRPAADSAQLGARQRAEAARAKFVPRRAALSGEVVLVDDVITTGSTLAAASLALAGAGIGVRLCAVLAATEKLLTA